MREDLHALLDGDEADSTEQLFNDGAFGSAEYREFRQHQRLRTALARNSEFGRLSTAESSSILDNVSAAVGMPRSISAPPIPTPPRHRGGLWKIGLAAVAGLAIGYGVNEMVSERQVVLTTPMPQTQALPAPPVTTSAFNYDSVVGSLRDSISAAMKTAEPRTSVAAPSSTRSNATRVRSKARKSTAPVITTGSDLIKKHR